ncbi:MAG: glycosyltransferase family 4 protein [Trueperaceae bacterium]|nr:MAG: glycosyltransferase family 4 protein [Trueperaceae bacterium]
MEGLLIITPMFAHGGSGSAVYYRLLADHLGKDGIPVTVISEQTRDLAATGDDVIGLFPQRSSRNRHPVRDALAHGWQNLKYLELPAVVREVDPATVLVHSSFYSLPGIFPTVMSRITKDSSGRRRFVADVRDVLMPPERVPCLLGFGRIIACSKSVEAHLIASGLAPERITLVPVLQEPLNVPQRTLEATLEKHNLPGRRYLFYAGLIKELKAVDLLLEAFLEHVRPRLPDLTLVVSGHLKTDNRFIRGALGADGVRYLGNLPRTDVLALMAGAALVVNLAPNEGLPRSSLEALALGRPTLLPPNVPEFTEHCREFVASSRSAEEIAGQMIELLERGAVPRYPIGEHAPERVLPLYAEILGEEYKVMRNEWVTGKRFD